MNVFVLCTGRCGSLTFATACRHMTNFTVGHESRASESGAARLSYAEGHIEVDNRLSWLLGRLEEAYGDSAVYVHLTGSADAVAESYHQRRHLHRGILRAYAQGVLQPPWYGSQLADDLVVTVNTNIAAFLRNKTKVHRIDIDSPHEAFKHFWRALGAEGSLEGALAEFKVRYNASMTPVETRPPIDTGKLDSPDAAQVIDALEAAVTELQARTRRLDAEKSHLKTSHIRLEAELARNRDALGKVQAKNQALTASLVRLRTRQEALTASVPYRLGVIVLNSAFRPWRWPKALAAVAGLWLQKHKQRQSASPLHSVDHKQAGAVQESRRAKNKENRETLYLASLIARSEGSDAAIQFAERHASSAQAHAIRLLKASLAKSDDEWLAHVNAYLAATGNPEIGLAYGEGSRFRRLRAVSTGETVDGPLVSVIMPAYNSQSTLAHAANSILAQTWRNLELIIVDDCSSDDTFSIAEAIAAEDSRVRVLRNPVNVGPYVSKNRALRLARGSYITGQDADDWSLPSRLTSDITLLQGRPGARAVLGKMLRMDERGTFQFLKVSRFAPDAAMRVCSIALLIETEFLRNTLGGWDSVRFSADSELIARAERLLADSFLHADTLGMMCLSHDSSLTNDPVHGVDPTMGLSGSRQEYKDAWKAWHQRFGEPGLYVPFPLFERPFPAPDSMRVPVDEVERVIMRDS